MFGGSQTGCSLCGIWTPYNGWFGSTIGLNIAKEDVGEVGDEAVVEALVSPLVSLRLASLVSSSIVTRRLAIEVVRLSHDDDGLGWLGCMSSVESEVEGAVGWCDNDDG